MVLNHTADIFRILRGSEAVGGRDDYYEMLATAMGTECRALYSAPSRAAADSFKHDVSEWIASFEARYSRFVPGSIISRMNANAGERPTEIDDELAGIFALCDWYHWLTRGMFDPTVLAVSRLWDWHSGRTEVPPDAEIKDAMQLVGWKMVERGEHSVFLPRKGMAIDIGGIGKEYAVDRVFEMGKARGFKHMMVDFGRDVRVSGSPPEGGPWRVGLEDPSSPGRCWTGVAVSDMAVASSGNYARRLVIGDKTYGHIVDPRTGYPADNGSLSATIIAPTCTEAGILSTAAIIGGPEEFVKFIGACHQAEGAMATERGRIRTARFGIYEIRAASRGGSESAN